MGRSLLAFAFSFGCYSSSGVPGGDGDIDDGLVRDLGAVDLGPGDPSPPSSGPDAGAPPTTLPPVRSATDLSCMGSRRRPVGGAPIPFTLEIHELNTDDRIPDLCVALGEDSSALCTGSFTDALGQVEVSAPAHGWFGYRVFGRDGATSSQTLVDSFQVNVPAPSTPGETVPATVASEATLALIPAVLGFFRREGTALISGRVEDCAGEPIEGAVILAHDAAGRIIPDSGARAGSKYRYFDGDELPSADQEWTARDGLYLGIDLPPDSGSLFVEAYGVVEGSYRVIGCETVPIVPDGLSLVTIGPLRADGPDCPGLR